MSSSRVIVPVEVIVSVGVVGMGITANQGGETFVSYYVHSNNYLITVDYCCRYLCFCVLRWWYISRRLFLLQEPCSILLYVDLLSSHLPVAAQGQHEEEAEVG